MSQEQAKLVGEMTAHNTTQLKQFFEGAAIKGDWQLVYASSHNGCIISLPAKGGGQMRLRIISRYRDQFPYLELRAEREGGSIGDEGDGASGVEKAASKKKASGRKGSKEK